MKKILCFLGFHKGDWNKAQVIDAFGNMWLPCKRCYGGSFTTMEIASLRNYIELLKSL